MNKHSCESILGSILGYVSIITEPTEKAITSSPRARPYPLLSERTDKQDSNKNVKKLSGTVDSAVYIINGMTKVVLIHMETRSTSVKKIYLQNSLEKKTKKKEKYIWQCYLQKVQTKYSLKGVQY